MPDAEGGPGPEVVPEAPILIVDDSPVDAQVAAVLVRRQLGLRAVFAANGAEALDVLARETPALVLTDLQMPKLDGLGLVRRLNRDYPRLPVVLMTARGSESIALEALQSGAASYVPKSALSEQLTASLRAVLCAAQQDRRRLRLLAGIKHLQSRLALDNDDTLVGVFIQHVQEHLESMGLCEPRRLVRVGIALQEALLNGMHHGNLELSSDLKEVGPDEYERAAQQRRQVPPYRDRRLHVEMVLTPAKATFVLRDEGPGFDLSKVPDPTDPENLIRPSGRGLLLMRTFLDEVRHNPKGNEVTLVVQRAS